MKNLISALIGIFIIFLINHNYNELNLINDKLHPYFEYFSNPTIRLFYYLGIIIDIILFITIILSFFEKRYPHLINKLYLTVVFLPLILCIILIIEYCYGSTFYYGEVRDKQGFPFAGINFGVIGIIVLVGYSSIKYMIYYTNKNKIDLK